jgi:hypothetical protein
MKNDDARMAAIGRAVVEYLNPGVAASREATPENVISMLTIRDDERRSLATCDALAIGRRVLGVWELLTKEKPE